MLDYSMNNIREGAIILLIRKFFYNYAQYVRDS